ncbi:regulatory YrvL family protein, partial [Escherichia coli]|nr:regulatory YrvL family protein [Escherichia coli]
TLYNLFTLQIVFNLEREEVVQGQTTAHQPQEGDTIILAKSLSLKKTALFAFILYFISNLITICFADYFMQSIYIPDVLLVVISAFMAIIELAFDNQPNREAA